MANQNTTFGARAVGNLLSGGYTGRVRTYTVLSTYAVAMYVGDFVKITGASANDELGKNHSVIEKAAANQMLVGFVVGFSPHSSYLNQIYRTASTLRSALVCDDPFVTFEIQASGTLATGDLQLVADITGSSGSTITGLSDMQLDLSTKSTSGGYLRMLALSPREDNDFGLYAKVICMFNRHQYRATTGV